MSTTREGELLPRATEAASPALAKSRARVYSVLSIAYARSPDERLLELLGAWVMAGRERRRGTFSGMMGRGLRRIATWLERNGSGSSGDRLNALGVEFTRLFRGLRRSQSPPPPYESVYVDRGLLYGPSTSRVAQEYRRFNLKGRDHDPPDYIAFELDFMRFLCEREARAWESENGGWDLLDEEEIFLTEHLARWVPTFCQGVRRFDTSGFYGGLAHVTEGWIYCDQKIVEGLKKLWGRGIGVSAGRF